MFSFTSLFNAITRRGGERGGAWLDIGAATLKRCYGAEVKESIDWDMVEEIAVWTSDEGPWGEDFYFLLKDGKDQGVAVGQELATRFDLLAVLQARFPGFDNSAFIAACGSTDNAMFVVWQRALADNGPLQTHMESAQ